MNNGVDIIKYLYSGNNGLNITTYYRIINNRLNTVVYFPESNYDELLKYLSKNKYTIDEFIDDTMIR